MFLFLCFFKKIKNIRWSRSFYEMTQEASLMTFVVFVGFSNVAEQCILRSSRLDDFVLYLCLEWMGCVNTFSW
jgi:hypothetical protein